MTSHPSGIPQEIVEKVVARRGGLYAFPALEPAKTALVVIDLDIATGRNDKQKVVDVANHINEMSSSLRKHGGTVAWVTTPIQKATENFRAVFGEELSDRYEKDEVSGESKTMWPELLVAEDDLHVTKTGHSAFFPGKSNLHEQLQARGVTTILIAGAVTNVCCEASARDGAELQYKVTILSDAVVGWSEEYNQVTFATFLRCYGDVRPSSDVVQLIDEQML